MQKYKQKNPTKQQLFNPKQTNNDGFAYRKKIRNYEILSLQWRRKYVVG